MSYCSNCGGRLGDNGVCPNCGGMSEANVKPAQMEDSDVLGCVKAFFSESPLKGVEKNRRLPGLRLQDKNAGRRGEISACVQKRTGI